jgi:hypothetical protein
LLVNARAVRTPYISLLFFYTFEARFNSVRDKTEIALAKKPYSVKQEKISGNLYIYCYIITRSMHSISVMFYTQNMLADFQIC